MKAFERFLKRCRRGASVVVGLMLAGCAQIPENATRDEAIDAQAQAIVHAHIVARGGAQRFAAIHSLSLYSARREGKQESRPSMIKMRPSYVLIGCTVTDCGYAEGFDGMRSWEMQPRRERAYTARGEAAKAIVRAGAIDFPFIDAQAFGHRVRFGGTVALDGKPAQRLDVRLNDGLEQIYYLDPQTHLLIANERSVPAHARGPRIPQRTYFSDWRPVAGVLYPFHLQTWRLLDGGVLGELLDSESGQWARIAANEIADPAIFKPPPTRPTAVTALILKLYAEAQSLSGDAILAQYRALRESAANRDFDSESDLTWLGYELLKDDSTDKANAVFEVLMHEHPKSWSAWDSLGDGRLQAGDRPGAIQAFRTAVELDPHAEDSAAKLKVLLQGSPDSAR